MHASRASQRRGYRSELRLTSAPGPLAFAPMALDILEKLRWAVRDVPDFPKKGIVFKDITPVLSDPVLFRASIDLFLDRCRGRKIDKIVGIDARGFLFGSAVAYELGVGFVPIRKRSKLPVLIRKAGGQLLEAQFLIELEFLHGRKQLEPTPVISFLKY